MGWLLFLWHQTKDGEAPPTSTDVNTTAAISWDFMDDGLEEDFLPDPVEVDIVSEPV